MPFFKNGPTMGKGKKLFVEGHRIRNSRRNPGSVFLLHRFQNFPQAFDKNGASGSLPAMIGCIDCADRRDRMIQVWLIPLHCSGLIHAG